VLELAVRVAVSLGVVLGLFWLVARAGSRRFSGGTRNLVRVRGRQSLSRTSSLAVVEVGSRVLVVGVSDGGVRLLTELDPTELDVVDEQPEQGPGARAGARARRREARPAPVSSAAPATALSGSVLSAQTWKQAWTTATRGRERDTA
jgi:flagellar protein FliO/FliZ